MLAVKRGVHTNALYFVTAEISVVIRTIISNICMMTSCRTACVYIYICISVQDLVKIIAMGKVFFRHKIEVFRMNCFCSYMYYVNVEVEAFM